jgi:hypothetical protein
MSCSTGVGIGILVEVARRLGMGFIAARDELKEPKPKGSHRERGGSRPDEPI